MTESLQKEREIIQVVWDMNHPETRMHEERALAEAEKELGIAGRIIDKEVYLRTFLQRHAR